MFSDAYISIEHGKAVALLEMLNPKIDLSPFPNTSRILCHSLNFYNGYSLYEVSDNGVNPAKKCSFIYKDNGTTDEIYVLNGTNEPIYSLNKSVPIFLNQSNIVLYVKFFFHYVRGKFGRFHIIENVDEMNWREEPSPAGRKALGKMIAPLELIKEDERGTYHLKGRIIFKDSLFEADFLVQENGNVNLNNQEILVEGIPVLDDSFNQ